MKKFSRILILLVCILLLTFVFAGCSKNYAVSNINFSKSYDGYSQVHIDISYYIDNLPEGTLKLEIDYAVTKNDGAVIEQSTTKTVVVEEGQKTTTLKDSLSLDKSDVMYFEDILKIDVSAKVTSVKSHEANRLKPYAIAIAVLAVAGVVAIVTLYAVSVCKSKKNSEKTPEKQ